MLRVEPRLHNTYRPSIKQDEKKKSAAQIELEEQKSSNGQLNQSKGLQYIEARQTTAQLTGPLKPTGNQTVRIITSEEKNQKSQSLNPQTINSTPTASYSSNIKTVLPANTEKINPIQQQSQLTRSPKVNIAQIIKDFKNTANAIGTPEDTYEEVEGYLGLVETQVKKNEPNIKLVQSNLRNASVILDKYISDTLNKESKVVENWIEAVFLQQVNYKYNETEINEALMVKIPEDKPKPEQKKEIPEPPVQKTKTNDERLNELLVQAKKTQDSKETIDVYQQALKLSVEIEDKIFQSKIHFELAKIYDKEDNTDKALENYSKTLDLTNDLNLKTKAHYSIAKINDEQKHYNSAINNYVDAIAYAGEIENLTAQTASLTKIANIYADNYDETAFKLYDNAKIVANESQSSKLKGYVSVNTAKAYEKFNKPISAFSFYKDAIKIYQEAEMNEKAAVNLKRAGDVIKNSKPKVAENCFKKAMGLAVEIKNAALIKDINKSFLTV